MTTILREELVEYSAFQLIRERLPAFGVTLAPAENATVVLREAFPTPEERQEELTMTTVAFGFNIDDGGRQMELGSNLTEYTHTLEVWTFATEPRFGRHLAHAIKHLIRTGDASIPLRDYNEAEDPIIDRLLVNKVQVTHQANNSPRPWDRYVWTTSIQVQDVFIP